MAIEDVVLLNLGVWGSFLQRSVERWTKAAMDARVVGYDINDLFETMREQFVENWDTSSELTRFSGYPVTPTVVIQGRFDALTGRTGAVYVRQRLTGVPAGDYIKTDLERIGNPADKIASASVGVELPTALSGGDYPYDFDGKAIVRLSANAPVAGVYRGLILVKFPTSATPEPLTWVVVVADA